MVHKMKETVNDKEHVHKGEIEENNREDCAGVKTHESVKEIAKRTIEQNQLVFDRLAKL